MVRTSASFLSRLELLTESMDRIDLSSISIPTNRTGMNEGDLKFGRLQGADASNDSAAEAFFVLKSAPEAFSMFDDLSFELSKLDLTQFRRGALLNDMRGTPSFGKALS